MQIPSEYAARIVVSSSGCWEWTGWTNYPRGGKHPAYGMLSRNGRDSVAHRYFYQLATGIDPGENHVHHRCKNTLCVNPDHLEMLDSASHSLLHSTLDKVNAAKREREACLNGHSWTPETITTDSEGYRACKTCLRQADEKHRRKKGVQPYFERTHCPQGHEYSGQNLLINTGGYKVCRTCQREKMKKLRAKRGLKGPKTHCIKGHPFAGENLYVNPNGRRICRICFKEQQQRYKAKVAARKHLSTEA